MNQPRDENGNFISLKEVSSDETVTFLISEFECRVIGNRLSRAATKYELCTDGGGFDQDCSYWSRKFLNECSLRENNDDEYYEKGKKRHVNSNYRVKVKMTDYEAWSMANKLFDIGELFEKENYDRVASETKWLARRFHAEVKQNNG
jgi:hypothetical protein